MYKVTLSQYSGGYKNSVIVRGSGFTPNDMTRIYWDNNLRGRMYNDANGAFEVPIEFPPPTDQLMLPNYHTIGLQLSSVPYGAGNMVATAQYYFDGTGEPYPTQPPPPITLPPADKKPIMWALLAAAGIILIAKS
jgi:hypothetical protein